MIISNPQKIEKAEIVVGIPSYNEAERIGFVTEQISLGLENYFPNEKSVIINLDNNSSDGTKEVFLETEGNIPKLYISTGKNIKGKGYNFYNLFKMVKKLKAKVGLAFDADLMSIQPEWVKKMARPIYKEYSDFVAPYYARYKCDATITNHLVYPLVYGLLAWNLRQPIGGDFAFSDKMVDIWLKEKWQETTYQFGIDIFMSLTALFANKKTSQVNLGAKIHKVSNTLSLGPMFFQVTETLFETILKESAQIRKKTKVKRPVILGGRKLPFLSESHLARQPFPDHHPFEEYFLKNFDVYWDSFKDIVSQPVYQELTRLYRKKQCHINLDLWTKIVYDFLFAFKLSSDKANVVEILRFLYFGRVATFFKQIADLEPAQAEEEIFKQAKYFFKNRDYFLSKITRE